MPTTITRVELHGVNHGSNEYAVLHVEMKKRGFLQSLSGDNGKSYELPTAEYFQPYKAGLSVLDDARAAAEVTGKRYSIVVSEATSIFHDGLPATVDENMVMNDAIRRAAGKIA